MINHYENQDENISQGHDINRPRSSHGHEYSKYIKSHLRNI